MLKRRLIPVLLLKNGLLIRSQSFSTHQILGNPVHEVARFNEWMVDELIYLDLTADDDYDLRRDDMKVKRRSGALDILDDIARTCFMPLTFGGRIRSVEDAQARITRGADKITLNTGALDDPGLVTRVAERFGAQATVVAIDALRSAGGVYEVFAAGGKRATGRTPWDWACEAERRGAGEILIQSIDRDGTATGYDLELIERVVRACSIPVIALGGVGDYRHFVDGIAAGADAVAAANIFHFKELSDRHAKRAMMKAGISVRG